MQLFLIVSLLFMAVFITFGGISSIILGMKGPKEEHSAVQVVTTVLFAAYFVVVLVLTALYIA